jgi:hypothetical protein
MLTWQAVAGWLVLGKVQQGVAWGMTIPDLVEVVEVLGCVVQGTF